MLLSLQIKPATSHILHCLSYQMTIRGIRLSLLHGVLTSSEAQPASYPMGTRGSSGGIVAHLSLEPLLEIHGAKHPLYHQLLLHNT